MALEAVLERAGLSLGPQGLEEVILEAGRRRWSYGRFLEEVLSRELALRAEKREGMLLRLARFPQIKTLEGFDLSHLPDLDPKVLAELGELGFLKRRENVLIQGPPGIGKTHLALALGLKAVKGGHKTYFTTLEEMIKRLLRTSASPKTMRVYTGGSLLIIDEVGYLPMGPAEAHLFFQVISARYEKGSVIITSNKGVGEWGEYLSDTTLAAALLDRFLHHCHVLNLKGDSYRLKDKKGRGRAKGGDS